ncbi:MAG: RDD family protein [Thermoplasmata archaeon]|nr:RDD family protein [Thermoplasmata archaeon]
MVDLGTLGSDVLQTTVYLSTPAVLWLFLYYVAWEDPEIALGSGFGRRTFWLLVPAGAIAWSLGLLPFFSWSGDILALNLVGGVFPIVLSGLFLARLFRPHTRTLGWFVGALAVESAVLFALVVLVSDARSLDLAALFVCVASPLLFVLAARLGGGSEGSGRRASLPLALTSTVLFLTFLTTQAVVGVGIESIFPFYLLAPIAAGLVAVPLARYAASSTLGSSLSLAYATTTLGTLVGADVLRQPPLYGVGKPALLAIGGAGLLDLIYLSGLIAAGSAYAFLKFVERRPTTLVNAHATQTARTPSALLNEALELGIAGRNAESAAASALAAESAVREARRSLGAVVLSTPSPWAGLGVPPWVEADHQNLRALASAESADAVDAGRAWTTSAWLVRLGRELARRPLATAERRGAAFGLDLAVTLPIAVMVWALLGWNAGGGILGFGSSLPFLAAAIGYPAYAFLYLVLAEAATGTTIGKWAVGLEVTDRDQRRPGPVAVLLRNVPKLIPLELVGLGGAVVTALVVDASTSSSSGALTYLGLGAVLLAGIVLGLVLLVLLIGWAGIQVSPERQRVGDYLAGTWVRVRPRRLPSP